MQNNKNKQLSVAQLESLPISVGEARKLLGSNAENMDDNEVALQILALNELAILLLKS